MRRILIAIALFLSACAPSAPGGVASSAPAVASASPSAGAVASGEFDADRAKAHVAYLADPARGGRYTGSPGYRDAAQYVADRFREIGLEPLGDGDSYFQHFPMPIVDLTASSVLRRLEASGAPAGEAKAYRHRVDFTETVSGRAGNGSAESTLVVVGGGIRGASSDFDGVITRGKIAVIPGQRTGSSIEAAFQEGAAGVIITGDPTIRFSYIPHFEAQTIPVIVASDAVVDELIGGRLAAARTATQARHADPSLAPTAFELPTRVCIEVPLTPVHDVDAINVIGLLRGSDNEGAKRAILVGGHLDGVGTDPDGTVFAGANDNAAGPAVAIEVARALAGRRVELRHSVVFVAFAGEEEGLLGSDAYAARMARVPGRAESLIGMFNLDVVACCGAVLNASDTSPDLQGRIRDAASALGVPFAPSRTSSDDASFSRRRVPAIHVSWSDPILHTTGDTLARIETWRLLGAGRVVTEATRQLASER